jgi:hypothetical protein
MKCHALAHSCYRRFAGAICDEAGADTQRQHRTNVDYRTTFAAGRHRWKRCAAAVKCAVEVDRQRTIPTVERDILYASRFRNSGDVEEMCDLPKAGGGCGNSCIPLVELRNFERGARCGITEGLGMGCSLFGLDVSQHHAASCCDELPSYVSANPLGPAADQGDFPLHIRHLSTPLL